MGKVLLVLALVGAVAGCATVRQSDVDAWVGVPIEALDTHSLFLTLPMVRTISASGVEIRNYVNKANVGSCFTGGNLLGNRNTLNSATYSAFTNCSSRLEGCDNIFYVRDGKVVEYAPTGKCFTDERVRPEARFYRMTGQQAPAPATAQTPTAPCFLNSGGWCLNKDR